MNPNKVLMRLRYRIYLFFQYLISQDRSVQKRLLQAKFRKFSSSFPKSKRLTVKIVEIGCGDGNMAAVFSHKQYTGMDMDPERIAEAKLKHPEYKFRTLSVFDDEFKNLCRGADFFYTAAVLHHLSNPECGKLMARISKYAHKPTVFVVFEPHRPDYFWQNPFSFVMALLDQGKFVRTKKGWSLLFHKYLEEVIYLKGPTLWPVDGAAYILKFS